jgi:hypothetical protein
MTKQEAETKWCPFARVGIGSSALSAAAVNCGLAGEP